ncbi:MAG: diaminobutyrate acetyltransferase [Kiritimatiellae bacterium]|nr:diaminobutyrate acetyltransferase [Kiritimatiellia bacterium]
MTDKKDILIRAPRLEDGAAMHSLIKACPPLDLNSAYLYFLVCDHFRETSIVAEYEGKLVGCISAYRRPDQPDVLFVWQVAVHSDARGQGMGRRMLDAVADRSDAKNAKWMETTISPSNTASRRLFASWAESHDLNITESSYLEPHHFQTGAPEECHEDTHEAECLFRIGPL